MYQGIKRTPLSYVTRTDIDPPDYGTDPEYLEPDSEYSSYQEEITARSPIHHHLPATFAADYTVDNKTVWELIASVCRDEDCWTHVKPFFKKKDGRNAFLALWDYYIGKQNVDNHATTSEKGLELVSWTHNTNGTILTITSRYI